MESRHGGGGYLPRGITLVRGRGARVEDVEGRSYVDCVSGHGVACLGHAHPALIQAVAEQSASLMSCPAGFGSRVRSRLLERLAEVTWMERFFLCNSGTEAVEAAIKYARLQTGRRRIIAAMRGFHGRTLGALSVTWNKRYRQPFEPLIPEVSHVPFDDLAALEKALADDVAAVLVEPIQGEGGVRLPGDDYLPGVRRLCDQVGALWILDEVQTGFGRTGRWLAYQQARDQAPDLVTLGKAIAGGVPMGALAIRPGLPPFPVGTHGSTFGGNPLACAASLATLEVLEKDGLIERSERLGAQALQRLRAGLADCEGVREVRGRGLMIGIELRHRVAPVLRSLTEDGILALAAGPTVIRLLPPLVIDEEDLAWVIERIIERLIQGVTTPQEGVSS